jgi:hypothetical protein
VGLATMNALVGAAERAGCAFDGLHDFIRESALLPARGAADGTTLTDFGQRAVELTDRERFHGDALPVKTSRVPTPPD